MHKSIVLSLDLNRNRINCRYEENHEERFAVFHLDYRVDRAGDIIFSPPHFCYAERYNEESDSFVEWIDHPDLDEIVDDFHRQLIDKVLGY